MVRRDRIAQSSQRSVDWSDPKLDFSRYSVSGVIGDPTSANAKVGERLWAEVVREAAAILHRIAQGHA